jgi:hypothetical protein
MKSPIFLDLAQQAVVWDLADFIFNIIIGISQ